MVNENDKYTTQYRYINEIFMILNDGQEITNINCFKCICFILG